MASPSQLREWAPRLFALALQVKERNSPLADELTAGAIGYLEEANGTNDPSELPPPGQTEQVVQQQQQQQGQRLKDDGEKE